MVWINHQIITPWAKALERIASTNVQYPSIDHPASLVATWDRSSYFTIVLGHIFQLMEVISIVIQGWGLTPPTDWLSTHPLRYIYIYYIYTHIYIYIHIYISHICTHAVILINKPWPAPPSNSQSGPPTRPALPLGRSRRCHSASRAIRNLRDGHLPVISGYKLDYTFYKWGFVSTYNW